MSAHPRPNYGAIFISLFVLTVIEIVVANLPLLKFHIVLLLVSLAIVKAALVAMFYMHLKFEKKLLAVIALGPLIFSAILAHGIGYDLVSLKPKKEVKVVKVNP